MNDGYLARHYRIFLAVSVVVMAISIGSLKRIHVENDEVIYVTLARKVAVDFRLGRYTLRGTEILETLPKKMYDTAIFFRPPVFVYSLAVFYRIFGEIGLSLFPILIYMVLVWLIYLTTLSLTNNIWSARKSLIITAGSSLLLFHSSRILVDLLLALLVFGSFSLLVRYKKRESMFLLLVSGLILVLAIMTKYLGVIVLPFFVYLVYRFTKNKARLLVNVAVFLMPLLIIGAWLGYLEQYGIAWSFIVSKPSAEMISDFAYVRLVSKRPFYYYLIAIFVFDPVYLSLMIPSSIGRTLEVKHLGFWVKYLGALCIWIIGVVSLFGLLGGTYQSRFMLMAVPFLIVMASIYKHVQTELLSALVVVAMLSAVFLYMLNNGVIVNQYPEIFSLFRLVRSTR